MTTVSRKSKLQNGGNRKSISAHSLQARNQMQKQMRGPAPNVKLNLSISRQNERPNAVGLV